ncbi:MAG: hypothetical protein KGI73_02300 [Patescibacteria group bacterium]|nr:hypothetical protein [Patescibacteria group bacterium]
MSAGRDLLLFILFLVVLGIAWFLTGGASRPLAHAGWFLNPPPPLGNGQGYNVPIINIPQPGTSTPGTTGTQSVPSPTQSVWNYFFNYRTGTGSSIVGGTPDSPYARYVRLSTDNARATNPEQQYITIRTTSQLNGALTITGWSLVDAQTGLTVVIGNAAQIPALGGMNSATPVSVGPSATVYIVTGASPEGVSFRINKCTGYFNQFQTFSPPLPRQCPLPQDEMLRHPDETAGNTVCQNYIRTIPQCTLTVTAMPGNIGSLCQNFILNTLSYNGCISEHQTDPDFYNNEWRLFLGRNQTLWSSSHDDIRLLDENGKLIAEVSY